MERQPTDAEVESVISVFEQITPYISPKDGTINGAGWREVYNALASLNEYELWLGVCNLESVIFDCGDRVSAVHVTMFELFQMAYEQGLEAL